MQESPSFAAGSPGGQGGFGFINKPITQPFSQPFSVGGTTGATTFANVGTFNGANPGGPYSPGAPGNPGNAPGATLTYPAPNFVIGGPFGGNGQAGVLVIFENIGT
jgi:hypothetical protein